MVGEQRPAETYPCRAMVDSGVNIAIGSEWPVSRPEPRDAIHVAVNRAQRVVPPEAGRLDSR